ncbi:MAG: hypothetical protein KF832_27770 [Caldilineaceae bacterium]|nr:hypothetical protein [Caldilineaceae bacterium]
MLGLRHPYRLWLLLFSLGIGLDTVGMVMRIPLWLRDSLWLGGVLLLLLSIGVAGQLQRTE